MIVDEKLTVSAYFTTIYINAFSSVVRAVCGGDTFNSVYFRLNENLENSEVGEKLSRCFVDDNSRAVANSCRRFSVFTPIGRERARARRKTCGATIPKTNPTCAKYEYGERPSGHTFNPFTAAALLRFLIGRRTR